MRMPVVRARLVAAAAVSAGVLALAACGSSGSGAGGGGGSTGAAPTGSGNGSLTKVTIATPANSAASAFAYVAKDAGFFKQNGLDVSFNTAIAPSATAAALVKGTIQATALTGTATTAHQKGLPVVNVVVTGTRAPFVMLGGPGIKSLSQLAGKTIVTSPVFGSLGAASNDLLTKSGLKGKVKLIELDQVNAKSALFTAGKADAIFEPLNVAMDDQAKRAGSTILSGPDSLSVTPVNGFAVTEAFLKSKPQVVKALVKSALQATNLMKNERSKATALIEKEFKLSADNAKKFLDFQAPSLVLSGVPTQQAFQNLADQYNAQPATDGTKVNWTAQMVADSWDTTIATETAKELGYSS
jgi:ABC-type nitrate/sulfonate/bicarbonate transport system substrate-binding protein